MESHLLPSWGFIDHRDTQVFKFLFLTSQMADDDGFFYIGTSTGDILKLNPRTKLLADTGPAKDKFSLVSRTHQGMVPSALMSFPRQTAQTFGEGGAGEGK